MRWSRWLAFFVFSGCLGLPMADTTTSLTGRRGADNYFVGDPTLPWLEIGRSVENRPIYQLEFGAGDDVTMIFGCFHGNEPASPHLVLRLADYLHAAPGLLGSGRRVVLVPYVNPDGYVRGTRRNARDVDLNRNYPTRNWGEQPRGTRKVHFGPTTESEPETRVVMGLLSKYDPDKILSIHQPLACNNSDGPAGRPLAELMARHNGYPVKPDIGFPTPGSFGTFAGKELGVPMVTLELPLGRPGTAACERLWKANRDALLAVIQYERVRALE